LDEAHAVTGIQRNRIHECTAQLDWSATFAKPPTDLLRGRMDASH